MWLESVPYEQSWANLHDFSDGDKAFEVELLDAYFEVRGRGERGGEVGRKGRGNGKEMRERMREGDREGMRK